ncbi:MAG: RidA family protein, partial [Pseudomonadota bacterium]
MTIARHHGTGRMSRIVVHNDTIYLCGQVGNRGDSVARQTQVTLEKIEALLAEAG